jgi:DNA-binding response OmpR family regulator
MWKELGRNDLDMKTKVVIIGSDRLVIQVLESRLSRQGYVVYTADNYEFGETLIREKFPHAVILDISNRRGRELHARAQKDAALQRVPIMTISEQDKLVFNLDSILATIHNICKRY